MNFVNLKELPPYPKRWYLLIQQLDDGYIEYDNIKLNERWGRMIMYLILIYYIIFGKLMIDFIQLS